MKRKKVFRAVVVAVLLLAVSCSGFGHEVCRREADVSTAMDKAAAYLGPPGVLVGEILTLGLGIACAAIDEAAHAPATLGLVACEDCAPAAPPADGR